MEHNYLIHHGILGQKWGKKNGPPYPIAPGDHSAAEKKAARKSGGSSPSVSQNIKDTSESIEKLAKAGNKAIDDYSDIKRTLSKKDNYEKAEKMSDDELRRAINRLNMERQYADLTSRDISVGTQYAKIAFDTTIAVSTLVASTAGAVLAVKKILG